MNDPRPISALTIAGSDSGGGAGIQADLKTFAAHGVHGLSAIAALTAQHTRGVTAVHVPDLGFLRAQLDACFDDFRIGAVKIGMLANAAVIDCVADALDALRTRLLPLATVITPNLPEAELLLGWRIDSLAAMSQAATALRALGAPAVLLKGGHLAGPGEVVDILADADGEQRTAHPRLRLEAHGTGCTLASAVAANLARGLALRAACTAAADYVHAALRGGYRPGRGEVDVLDHFAAMPGR